MQACRPVALCAAPTTGAVVLRSLLCSKHVMPETSETLKKIVSLSRNEGVNLVNALFFGCNALRSAG